MLFRRGILQNIHDKENDDKMADNIKEDGKVLKLAMTMRMFLNKMTMILSMTRIQLTMM